jgi:hypothetical protein
LTVPVLFWLWLSCDGTAKTAWGTASTWLFFVVVEPPEQRISAGEETWMADNSLLRTAKTASRGKTVSAARRAS